MSVKMSAEVKAQLRWLSDTIDILRDASFALGSEYGSRVDVFKGTPEDPNVPKCRTIRFELKCDTGFTTSNVHNIVFSTILTALNNIRVFSPKRENGSVVLAYQFLDNNYYNITISKDELIATYFIYENEKLRKEVIDLAVESYIAELTLMLKHGYNTTVVTKPIDPFGD